MHHLLRSLSVVLCAVSVLGSSQCQNNGTSSSPAFVTTMSVEDVNSNPSTSFSSGQTIQFVLSVRNRAQTKQTIYLQPCVNIYADVVFKAGTSNIAASFVGPQGGCLQLLDAGAATVIAAGQTLQYTYSWDQMGPDGQLVPPGNYEVMGGLSCYENQNPQVLDTVDCLPPSFTSNELSPALLRSTLVQFTIQQ